MGCVSSKQARSDVFPRRDSFSGARNGAAGNRSRSSSSSSQLLSGLDKVKSGLLVSKEEPEKDKPEEPAGAGFSSSAGSRRQSGNLTVLKKENSKNNDASFGVNVARRLTEGEFVAAGWPAWLSSVAGEAIDGWLPLRADMFQRSEKIGQGTYSTVYRARDNESGKMVALKKVRFDNFQPESVRFMAREITILRRLDHPNIMKLMGIVTSRLSCSIYLVFEYMEHDLAGLLSCPEISFSESQIKCYMKQLLSGLEHCHSTGVIHRDIKVSNILVSNEGVLKIADFGLANFMSARNKQPLTSRVVTLWYRPPELLLGSTNYGETVDLWSAGCVFAELFSGRPFLKGRTEVEQLHKIFKLCGSPSEDYWKKSKLPLATVFKPQHPYESVLRERCREFPKDAVDLLETLLSVEPYNRGTASSALDSEYFNSPPYACDPSSLEKYPPNKEMDAKLRDEERRKKAVTAAMGSAAAAAAAPASKNPRKGRKVLQESSSFSRVIPPEEVEVSVHFSRRNTTNNGGGGPKGAATAATKVSSSKPSCDDTRSDVSLAPTELSQADTVCSAPPETAARTTKNQKPDSSSNLRTHNNYPNSRNQKPNNIGAEPYSSAVQSKRVSFDSSDRSPENMAEKRASRKQRLKAGRMQSFDSSEIYQARKSSEDNEDQQGRTGLIGPLFHQTNKYDARHQDTKTRQAARDRRSRFSRENF
ncbi:probable serine/threonine-protein kinase At1g54610 [Ipomoea triloba]|uniref:probable serine/threonine-protein kinase At1g54610 n=1 Tax=Ipomoea triloba TaxID=35885 RepID=UPI00125DE142|nr:probable serine/threonine-protein kinase At1g54610 [Ipomoea triloba]